jgi:hypothetical protein
MSTPSTVEEISSSRSLRRKLSKFIKLHHPDIYQNKQRRLTVEAYIYLLKMVLIAWGKNSLHIVLDALDGQIGESPTIFGDFANALLWRTYFRVSEGKLVSATPYTVGYRPLLKEVAPTLGETAARSV